MRSFLTSRLSRALLRTAWSYSAMRCLAMTCCSATRALEPALAWRLWAIATCVSAALAMALAFFSRMRSRRSSCRRLEASITLVACGSGCGLAHLMPGRPPLLCMPCESAVAHLPNAELDMDIVEPTVLQAIKASDASTTACRQLPLRSCHRLLLRAALAARRRVSSSTRLRAWAMASDLLRHLSRACSCRSSQCLAHCCCLVSQRDDSEDGLLPGRGRVELAVPPRPCAGEPSVSRKAWCWPARSSQKSMPASSSAASGAGSGATRPL
mmetsp:Transcript_57672/g.149902  ORF Transcript_57672/g.149902 Transcript_57672/m.149902 type:complete len:269 (+) Transcript_57672:622-1428(+)